MLSEFRDILSLTFVFMQSSKQSYSQRDPLRFVFVSKILSFIEKYHSADQKFMPAFVHFGVVNQASFL